MPYIWISSYSGPPATLTICTYPSNDYCYTHPTQITDISVFPYVVPLPSTFDGYNQISLSAQSDNGCLVVQQDTCSVLPTPTATFEATCYYWFITPTDGWTAGDVLNYTDCYGNSDSYTTQAGDSAGFYICAQGLVDGTNLTWNEDVPTLICEEIDGEWVGPVPPSQTPTPSNFPTPTPTQSSGATLYETFQFNISGNAYFSITFLSSSILPMSVDWGDGNVTAFTPTNTNQYIQHIYTGAYTAGTKTVTVSAQTSTPGVITSFLGNFSIDLGQSKYTSPLFRALYRPYNDCYDALSQNGTLSATTAELGKMVNVQGISAYDWNTWVSGDIAEFSACTNLLRLTLGGGDYYGDVNNLPNSITELTMTNVITVTYDFGFEMCEIPLFGASPMIRDINTVSGNVANLPTSLTSLDIRGNNTLTGNITGFSNQNYTNFPTYSKIVVGGNNTISGNFSDLPDINSIAIFNGKFNVSTYNMSYITTGNTITGNLTLKPYQSNVLIGGANTISGTLSGTSNNVSGRMNSLLIAGNNTISGPLSNLVVPSGRFMITGNNTISGDLGTMNSSLTTKSFNIFQKGNTLTPTAMTVTNSGNTITGNLSVFTGITSLKQLILGGNNTVYGDISGFSPMANMGQLIISSSGNAIDYNATVVTQPLVLNNTDGIAWVILYTQGSGLNTVQINNMFIWTGGTGPTFTGALYLMNNDGSRSFATINGSGNAAPTGPAITVRDNYNSTFNYPTGNNGKITTN
jgi:hypothetical protein